jgi:hypothetical protein
MGIVFEENARYISNSVSSELTSNLYQNDVLYYIGIILEKNKRSASYSFEGMEDTF